MDKENIVIIKRGRKTYEINRVEAAKLGKTKFCKLYPIDLWEKVEPKTKKDNNDNGSADKKSTGQSTKGATKKAE